MTGSSAAPGRRPPRTTSLVPPSLPPSLPVKAAFSPRAWGSGQWAAQCSGRRPAAAAGVAAWGEAQPKALGSQRRVPLHPAPPFPSPAGGREGGRPLRLAPPNICSPLQERLVCAARPPDEARLCLPSPPPPGAAARRRAYQPPPSGPARHPGQPLRLRRPARRLPRQRRGLRGGCRPARPGPARPGQPRGKRRVGSTPVALGGSGRRAVLRSACGNPQLRRPPAPRRLPSPGHGSKGPAAPCVFAFLSPR
ncbi:basic proline-rich protein-like [Lathamus discolor]|uniref:basic proline-rich protein-like n=1 Tax=Lathamus discolor TaxID=678569 RepID=UPI0032B85A76